jgi:LmbE family N-acetylglucosaminyl deacetylase
MTSLRSLLVLWLLALTSPFFALGAQERGVVALAEALRGLDAGARVLVIAAHPDDEDTRLIAWLARGRQVETAYLSLTRGDGGQNLIGNELGEALGVIRSEELLTARTIDGGRQFFTRAFDFGYSKSAEESFRHWPREELLRDVVTVVRAFRPHVIVSIFSGTPRDGHGQHQVAGMLAREAYDISGDGTRFPAAATAGHAPWTPLKFYRSSNFARDQATLAFNVGEYSHLIGRSFAEIAGESRSQHKSQGFGVLQRRGVVMGYVRREHTRAPAPDEPSAERSVLDGIGTLPAMLRALITGRDMLPQLVAVEQALAAVRDSADPLQPATVIEPLYRLRQSVASLATRAQRPAAVRDPAAGTEAMTLLRNLDARAERAMLLALGAAAEPVASHALLAEGDTAGIEVAVYNRGPASFTVDSVVIAGESVSRAVTVPRTLLLSDSAMTVRVIARGSRVSQPWWLATPRAGGMFTPAIDGRAEGDRPIAEARIYLRVRDQTYALSEPVVFRFADPVRGDVQRALAVVPAIDLTLDRATEYLPAGERVQRTVGVRVRSASVQPREVRVRAELPRGLRADTMTHVVTLQPFESRVLTFRVEGTVSPGRDSIRVLAESGGRQFATGYTALDYEHIRSRQLHRPSTLAVEAVPVVVPSGLRVAYIRGVGDNGLAALEQLGVPVVALDPGDIPATDLSRFTTIVVGPRAYAAHQELVRHNALLLAFVRRGGTMVVQYGQYEMMRSGIMPFPVSIRRPHDRVTDERAPVSMPQPGHRLLRAPNAITATDFSGWVQERALYMPAEFDQAYTSLLAMNDPGEEPNRGALLVAPYGEGTYVYTTLAFFRQLPAGVPGAARLFVNLLVPDQRDAAQRVAP